MTKDQLDNQGLTVPFSKLEALLAIVQNIASDKRTAFQSRLKNLHRAGFPGDLATENGKPTQYLPHHVVQVALAVELLQLGLSGERAAQLLKSFDVHAAVVVGINAAFYFGESDRFHDQTWKPDAKQTVYLVFDPCSLSGLMDEKDAEVLQLVQPCQGVNLLEVVGEFTTLGGSSRLAIINLTDLIRTITPPPTDGGFDRHKAFTAELRRWAEEEGNRVSKKA